MTAPELVEVVAGVLEAHQFSTFDVDGHCVCTCDAVVMGEGEGWEEYPAHQARAVLAALTEAGAVEWGVEREGEVIGYYDERHARLSAAASVLHGNSARVVSRLTLPWERAE